MTQNHENPRESNGYAIIWQGLYIWNPRCQHRYRANHSSLKMPWHSARYLVSTRGPEARPKESIELPNVQLPRLHLHPRHLHPPWPGLVIRIHKNLFWVLVIFALSDSLFICSGGIPRSEFSCCPNHHENMLHSPTKTLVSHKALYMYIQSISVCF